MSYNNNHRNKKTSVACNTKENKDLPYQPGLAIGGHTAHESKLAIRYVRTDAIVDHP